VKVVRKSIGVVSWTIAGMHRLFAKYHIARRDVHERLRERHQAEAETLVVAARTLAPVTQKTKPVEDGKPPSTVVIQKVTQAEPLAALVSAPTASASNVRTLSTRLRDDEQ